MPPLMLDQRVGRIVPVGAARDRWRCLLAAFCCALAVAGSGCQKEGVTRYRVSGRVTYDGKDLPAGMIYFEPDSARGNNGATGYATIEEGRFDTALKKGKGAIGGAMVVRVNGHEKPASPQDESPGVVLVRDHVETADFPQAATEWNVNVPRKK